MLLISTGLISWGLFIGVVGMALFIVGKKTTDAIWMVTGIALMVYPYFIGSLGWSVIAGIAILGVAFLLKYVIRI